ncbi:methylated in normal thymocytes [Rhinolophus ferrumequinum]|uniref:Methylated in normal thymocytes n=1 Tax=Rhinolophus ferrumequinum TaxID=59479 RepID=A0A7J7SVQ5_RHIFE|nr:methylated in normal thymocytes [Rhinolophus ferrumequinum]
MVPAAGALLWVLLLSLGSRAAAGARGLTSTGTTGTRPVSFRFQGPKTRNYPSTALTAASPKRRVTMEDEDDIVATADRLAGPAAAELLASTVSTGVSGSRSWEHEDETLEEGVPTTTSTTSATTSPLPPLSSRLRPTPMHLFSPSPALAFWRRVRIGLEDIWNSLSSVFTEMQPIDRNQR